MSGLVYPPEILTEPHTPPIACHRFLFALAAVLGGDAPGFGWFASLSVCEAAANVLCPRNDVFVTMHRQKLENAAPVFNHYFSKIHDISPLKAKPAIQKIHTSLQTYSTTAGNPFLATVERPRVYIELECP